MTDTEYRFREIEKKWQQKWDADKTFRTDIRDFSKPKYYVLDMFPYPSGQGLHVGHPEGYTASDIVARFKRMQGYNVLHPMGFDSFGLPAEQYAIKTGNHPDSFTQKNIATFTAQLKSLGFSFDWDRQVSTCDPAYYKWTQWIFEQLFKAGLVRYIDMPVNWCEELGTVLANDEVIDGKSERGGFPVIKKNMKQWIIDIPQYAQQLLDGLKELQWPDATKNMQSAWIGRSEGARITFHIANSTDTFDVFTTRCDTLYGVTYCVFAPEHKLVPHITTPDQRAEVEAYIKACASKSDIERTNQQREKTGVFTGAYAINPVNGKSIPIYLSDYVLASYGSGAIMAVPAHDQRDWDFAKKFNLPIIPVIQGGDIEKAAYEGDGVMINSDILNGINGKKESIKKMCAFMAEKGFGEATITYRLREWIFARQRYWGEPVPVLHKTDGTVALVPEAQLPVVLPEMTNYKSVGGLPPLENAKEWVNVTVDGAPCRRETATMPGSAGSSWYFLRYIDPHNDKALADKELLAHWMPVDLYVGGAEHAVGHLLYARFWNRFLHDKGYTTHAEPFKKLVHPGMILGENNEKMSKSRGNVVNPDDMIASHGADSLRLYEMFMGPITDSKPWNTKGMDGAKKFLDRVWRVYTQSGKITDAANPNLDKIYHQTVKKVTSDYESLSFNTAISQMMIFINAVYKEETFPRAYAEAFLQLLNPIAPFVTEELWERMGHTHTITYTPWPQYDEAQLREETIEIVIQVMGKKRSTVRIAPTATQEQVLVLAKADSHVQPFLDAKQIVKVIYVPQRLLNIVIK